MLQFLEEQLGEDYLIESKESIENKIINVYKYMNNNKTINPETFVQLNKKQGNECWDLFSVQRDQKFRQGQFNDKNTSLFALYILAKGKLGSDNARSEVRDKLINLESTDSLKAHEIIHTELDNNLFSLSETVKGAMNLEHVNNGNYNIYYLTLLDEKIPIIENREAPNVYLVLYNFAVKLADFQQLFNEWNKTEKISLDTSTIEKVKRIYLNK